ncbi:LysR family transcriptional regulator [Saccharopolyspora endophytica]|uniref:LysR family transcriptional regulator n=1 Tax=Saccharopolyspora endophytica TaxID=543886 RepID=A0ABS5DQ42_9PSEU|nr:LysR family transcriptional regulator [Saccharopolyspora endophytica]MBQ0928368.1 LysR family transcriptional regulator [Saccharopolyspora endophytica]
MNLGQVDLNLLVVLDALLREQNVTRAAERLHMSQPATSTALARLRKLLGDPLLVKQGRYLRLTPRGEALVEPVREVLGTIEQHIVAPPDFDPAHDERTFNLASSDYVGVVIMRPLLERVNGLMANVRLEMGALSGDAARMIERDEIDLVILPEVLAESMVAGSCSSAPVVRDRYVGAVWSQHPLAGGSLPLDALTRYPYLAYAPPNGCSLMDEDIERAGVTPRVEVTSVNFITMPFLMAGTDLVTIIPESLGKQLAPAAGIELLEPEFPLRPVRESAYWHSRRDADPAHRWLREQLLAVLP